MSKNIPDSLKDPMRVLVRGRQLNELLEMDHFALASHTAKLQSALDELCRLKELKDKEGKTDDYLRDKERAWNIAFALSTLEVEPQ